jgi:CRP-like cAMP-binding protein
MPYIRVTKAGERLFTEGETSNAIFIVRRGAVSIKKTRSHENDDGVELAKVTSGEIIGELSFFDRLPRSATAIAIIETETLEIGFDELDKLYAGIPDYMRKIIEALASRLRHANEQLTILKKRLERS